MGEMADAMINGDFDFYTGEYMGRGFGFPRTKNRSLDWEKRSIAHRKRGQRFRQEDFTPKNQKQGIEFWLYDKGVKNAEKAHNIIREYVFFKGWEDIPNKRFITKACVKIQKEFPEFITYFNTHNENQQTK